MMGLKTIKLGLRVQQVSMAQIRIKIPASSQSHGPNPCARVWNKLGPYKA